MSEILLLTDRGICPYCRVRRSPSGGVCHNCGTRLFTKEANFQAYEDDGNLRTWWLYIPGKGWVHRDHVMLGFKPLTRTISISDPKPQVETAQERAARDRKATRAKILEMAFKK